MNVVEENWGVNLVKVNIPYDETILWQTFLHWAWRDDRRNKHYWSILITIFCVVWGCTHLSFFCDQLKVRRDEKEVNLCSGVWSAAASSTSLSEVMVVMDPCSLPSSTRGLNMNSVMLRRQWFHLRWCSCCEHHTLHLKKIRYKWDCRVCFAWGDNYSIRRRNPSKTIK